MANPISISILHVKGGTWASELYSIVTPQKPDEEQLQAEVDLLEALLTGTFTQDDRS